MVLAMTVAVFLTALPAGAITNGEPDTGNRYSMVGLIVLEVDGGVGSQCSGVLVAPKVFVTAGHCTYNAVNYWQATHVWISFEPTFVEADPFAGPLVDVTDAAGLSDHLFWHPAYVPPSAAYGGSPKHDVGVIVLPRRVRPAGGYAQLPSVGRLDEMLLDGSLTNQVFTSAGYGCELGWPAPSGPQPWGIVACDTDRTIGTHSFAALTRTWLKISENYHSTGSSGGGPGDSGAPVFFGDSFQLAGSMFDGGDVAGTAQVNVMRFDERSNRDFITSFFG